jgi:hypothetical protein
MAKPDEPMQKIVQWSRRAGKHPKMFKFAFAIDRVRANRQAPADHGVAKRLVGAVWIDRLQRKTVGRRAIELRLIERALAPGALHSARNACGQFPVRIFTRSGRHGYFTPFSAAMFAA